jgi:hypothetical protein
LASWVIIIDYNLKLRDFWEGTKINFSGHDVEYFYNQIKQNKLDRKIFDLIKLSFAQVDFYYLKQATIADKTHSVKDFM